VTAIATLITVFQPLDLLETGDGIILLAREDLPRSPDGKQLPYPCPELLASLIRRQPSIPLGLPRRRPPSWLANVTMPAILESILGGASVMPDRAPTVADHRPISSESNAKAERRGACPREDLNGASRLPPAISRDVHRPGGPGLRRFAMVSPPDGHFHVHRRA